MLIEGVNLLKCDIWPAAWQTPSDSLVFLGTKLPRRRAGKMMVKSKFRGFVSFELPGVRAFRTLP